MLMPTKEGGAMSKLKDLRLAKLRKYQKQNVAAALGVSWPTYDTLENDPSRMTRKQAEMLADYLDVPVNDIFLASNSN